jgi:pimeloyl-ACP methyl ester carboxylesterase
LTAKPDNEVCVRFRQKAVMNTSATFVLVHGAWLGGWCWKKVVPLLRAAGHEIFTPTLTGLGERAHLLTQEVGLDTHIEDVVAVLEYEDLTNVVLVGHSYAGMVIAGVAQRAAHRLAELVYLDSFLPESGKSLDDYLPALHPSDDGRIKPLDPRTGLGVIREADVDWMAPRLRDHPARADSQPVDLSRPVTLRQTYIRCSDKVPCFVESAERAKRQGFRFFELRSANHCPMVTQPDELAKILLALV